MNRIWMGTAAVLGLAATPALAQRIDHVGPDRGLYFGAGLGEFAAEIDELDDVDIDFDADDDAWKVFVGWRFNPYVGVEVAYIDFGTPETAVELFDVSADATGIAPYVVGTLPLGMVELFAKAGWIFYDLELQTNGEIGLDDSGNDFAWGAGVGVTLLERLHLRGEYERVEIDDLDSADAIWLNASWRF